MSDTQDNRPEILFLAHRIPYPPDKGDKIRSWRWLQFLAARFRVHLVCFVDDARDFAHAEFLSTLCETIALIPLNPMVAKLKSLTAFASGKPLSFHYFHDARMVAAVRTARARPLVAEFAFSSAMAPFIEIPIQGRARIIDFCDADSEKWSQYASDTNWLTSQIYTREGRLLKNAETHIANWADASFAVTAEEAEIFHQRPEMAKRVGVLQNGVDTAYFDPLQITFDRSTERDVIFVGAMDYRANVEGVLKFVETTWPSILADRPDTQLAVVGANPVAPIKALDGKHGITVTGRVDDVRPWLAGAKVAIAPLRVGRGVQNKVLEAMAMTKPVVASAQAMTGINAPSNAAVTATDPAAMAAEILTLLDDAETCAAIGAAARAYVIEEFSWEASLSQLQATFETHGL